eukprot:447481-Pelagomonas_calceolata.AAC.5
MRRLSSHPLFHAAGAMGGFRGDALISAQAPFPNMPLTHCTLHNPLTLGRPSALLPCCRTWRPRTWSAPAPLLLPGWVPNLCPGWRCPEALGGRNAPAQHNHGAYNGCGSDGQSQGKASPCYGWHAWLS